jgi:hypothetical protein
MVASACSPSSGSGAEDKFDDWLVQLAAAQQACDSLDEAMALNDRQRAAGTVPETTMQQVDVAVMAVYVTFDEMLKNDPTLYKALGSDPDYFYQLRDAALAQSGADMETLMKAWTFAPTLCEYADRYPSANQGS